MGTSPQQTRTTTAPPVPEIRETTGAGPLTTTGTPGTNGYGYTRRRVSIRSRLERIGFWVIVAAAFVLLLFLLKATIPALIGSAVTGGVVAAFVGLLTLMNMSGASHWANVVLGRKVFPVVRAVDTEIIRLAGVNTVLTFLFTFAFQVVAFYLGGLLGGLLVFGALIAAAIFYNRIRTVVIKP